MYIASQNIITLNININKYIKDHLSCTSANKEQVVAAGRNIAAVILAIFGYALLEIFCCVPIFCSGLVAILRCMLVAIFCSALVAIFCCELVAIFCCALIAISCCLKMKTSKLAVQFYDTISLPPLYFVSRIFAGGHTNIGISMGLRYHVTGCRKSNIKDD